MLCVRVERQTADVKTIAFEPVQGDGFRWAPGQYLTLSMDVAGSTLSRCYTISSIPGGRDRVEITVKRLAGGTVSTWLHDAVAPGTVLSAHGPLGRFTPEALIRGTDVPRYLFLAAGTGITPLMSISRALLQRAERADAVLLNSVHSAADLIFGGELQAMGASSGIRVEVMCGNGSRDGFGSGVSVSPGRLNATLLRRLVPDFVEREIFSCGPPGYLDAVRAMLDEAGCDPRRCHEESFDINAQPNAMPLDSTSTAPGSTSAPPASAPAAPGFTVEFARSGRTVDCGPDTFVLDAAIAAGITVPSSCGQGLCGTCKSGLVQGTVDMNHAGGIRPREIAQGKILICCSKPTANLVIDA